MTDPTGRAALVAVAGDNECAPDDPRYGLAVRLGRALVDAGYHVLTGGGGGVMEAVARGGRAALFGGGGRTIGVLPGGDPAAANPYVDVVIPTGIGLARNAIVAHAPAVVGVGGRAGTLSELALAWQLGRLVVALSVEGWSGRLAGARLDDRVRVPAAEDDRVFAASSEHDVLSLLGRHFRTYAGRPPPSAPRVLYAPQPLDRPAEDDLVVTAGDAETCLACLVLAVGADGSAPAGLPAPLDDRRTFRAEGPDRAACAASILEAVTEASREGFAPVAAAVLALSDTAARVRVGFVRRRTEGEAEPGPPGPWADAPEVTFVASDGRWTARVTAAVKDRRRSTGARRP